MGSLYDILGVSSTASIGTIKRAFRKKAVLYHPDKNPGDKKAEETFKKLNEAYQILSDPDRRAAYDLRGSESYSAGGHTENQGRYQSTQNRQYGQRRAYTKEEPKPPITPWKAYTLVIGVIIVLSCTIHFAISYAKLFDAIQNYEEALHLYNVGHNKLGAISKLDVALKRDSEYQEAYALYADIMIDMGRAADVLYHAEMAFSLKEEPYEAKDYFRLAHCFLALHKYKSAYEKLKLGIQLNPDNEWALYQLADLSLYQLKEYDKAIDYFNDLLGKSAITDYQAVLHKGVAHQQLLVYDSSAYCFEQVLDENPNNPVARYYLGKQLLLHDKDTAASCKMLRFAYEAGIQEAHWYVFNLCSKDSTSVTE